jgi:protein pelota
MRVLHQDRQAGEIKMQMETLDDLWHLYNIIAPGDIAISVTYRRDESKTDKLRAERGEKKRMVLGIRTERVEFHESESRLRVHGVIVEGPQDVGSYHTLNLGEGDVLTVRKEEWNVTVLDRVRRAVEDSKKPNIVFVSLENDEATIAVLRQYGLKNIATITGPSGGKFYDQKEGGESYYEDIISKVRQLLLPGVPLVILGPGFAKETLLTLAKQTEPELFRHAFIYHTGQAGMQGIHELMKRGIGIEVLKDSRVSEEMALVEKALEEVAKDGPVAYGPAQVAEAVRAGAVELLLVLDTKVKEKEVEEMMASTEQARGRVVVVSEHHEGGMKLESLGGLAALLRYRITY